MSGALRRQLEIVRLAKLAISNGGFQRFRVKNFSDYPDSLLCRSWDGQTEGANDVQVAKPWDIRRSPFDGRTFNGVTYSYISHVRRTASKAGANETQIIIPPYLLDSEIYALRGPAGGSGVSVDGESVGYVEFSARAFAAEADATLLGATASGGILITGGVQNNVGAERDPAAGDDSTAGYALTSVWVNVVTNKVFLCAQADPGQAVWKEAGGAGAATSELFESMIFGAL